MVTNEKELIKALKNSKTKDIAFKWLLNEYKERLYWVIRSKVLLHEDTDDILQNTFIKVFKHIDTFKEDSKLFTWLYRIACNETYTFLKKQAKNKHVSESQIIEERLIHLKSDPYFNGDEVQLKLQLAIAKLPKKQQEVFNLKYFQNYTYETLSELLETSIGGLKSNYHLAVKKITAYLKEND